MIRAHDRSGPPVALAFALLLGAQAPAIAAPGGTERVSVPDPSTGMAQGNRPSDYPRVSDDGLAVAFRSDATNLVLGDTNGHRDVFVHDRALGTTERESVSSSGEQGNADSGRCQGRTGLDLTGDGRFVAFIAAASNLVTGDTNGQCDDFVRDRAAGTTVRVSVPDRATGQTQANAFSGAPSSSANGRIVAFSSDATNLTVGGSTPGVFVHDGQSGATVQIAAPLGGTASAPSISADGRFVAFVAPAAEVAAVWVYDRLARTYDLVSVGLSGERPDGDSSTPSISDDGAVVSFVSSATNLVPGDTNGLKDVFVRDRLARTTERASVSTSGDQANGKSRLSRVSGDGLHVVYQSFASNLVAGDTNRTGDAFLRDVTAGTTVRVSVPDPGTGNAQANGNSSAPDVSVHGESVAFDSSATNLVVDDTNAAYDVFVHDS